MPSMLPHLAGRLYDVPLLIHRPKLDAILNVLGSRIQLQGSAAPDWLQLDKPVLKPPPGIAVISIHGTLVRRTGGLDPVSGMLSYDTIAAQLDEALANPEIRGILLSVDSAGGEAGGVFDLADKIYVARRQKPIWAIADDMAFSAAYAIASAADQVWVTRTGGVGSIGVIALHVDQSARNAMDGMVFTPIYAGERKNDLSPHQPLADRARLDLQAEVDRLYELFLATVFRNRSIDMEAVRATEAGLFYAYDALARGLADGVASQDELLPQFAAYLARRRTPFQTEVYMTTPKEKTMSDEASALPQLNQTVQSGSIPLTLTTQEAVEIAQLCTLAKCPEQIVGFLETNAKPEQVRRALIDAKATASPEIQSWLDPESKPSTNSPASTNPLMVAVQRLAERQQFLKKEH